MLDKINLLPPGLEEIEAVTEQIGFTMASDHETGTLLRTLVAAKPSGRFLELGTGTGVATSWIVAGMSEVARLITVERNRQTSAIARQYLQNDARVTFEIMDGEAYIHEARKQGQSFDLIFADMPPGKFSMLQETLDLLNVGGIYVIDDLIPLPAWDEGHAQKVADLIAVLEARSDLFVTKLQWSTGLLIATKHQ